MIVVVLEHALTLDMSDAGTATCNHDDKTR